MDELINRTEAPTLRRREEARRDGHVPRSADLAPAAMMVGGFILLAASGPGVLDFLKTLMTDSLAQTDVVAHEAFAVGLRTLMPLMLGVMGLGAAVNFVQVGARLDLARLATMPRRQPFATRIARIAMSALKLGVVVAVVVLITRGRFEQIVAIQFSAPAGAASFIWDTLRTVGLRIGIALLILAALDYAWQRWRLERSLRMTRREMQEEIRQTEGDPKLKARRRELVKKFAEARMNRT